MNQSKEYTEITIDRINVYEFITAVRARCHQQVAKGRLGALSKYQMLRCVSKIKQEQPNIVVFEEFLLRMLAMKRITVSNGSFRVPEK
jgi:hypothetical protein